jgi:hypothetical protein
MLVTKTIGSRNDHIIENLFEEVKEEGCATLEENLGIPRSSSSMSSSLPFETVDNSNHHYEASK